WDRGLYRESLRYPPAPKRWRPPGRTRRDRAKTAERSSWPPPVPTSQSEDPGGAMSYGTSAPGTVGKCSGRSRSEHKQMKVPVIIDALAVLSTPDESPESRSDVALAPWT